MADKIRFKSVAEALTLLVSDGYGIDNFCECSNEFTAVKRGEKDIDCRFDSTQTIIYAKPHW